MNLRSLFPSPVAVCDLSESATRVMLFNSRPDLTKITVLGKGEVATEGVKDGSFTRLADVTDSIWQAAVECEKQSGEKIISLIISLDDPFLESVRVKGSAYLDSASDEFQHRHIQEAKVKAMQSLAPQDKHLVYEKEAGFLIDRQDYIENPLGICGKELTVIMHLLFSKSQRAQDLKRLVERAGFASAGIFPSGMAGMHGVLNAEQMREKGVLLVAGKNVCHWTYHDNGAIQSYQSLLVRDNYSEAEWQEVIEKTQRMRSSAQAPAISRVTGEMADDAAWMTLFRERVPETALVVPQDISEGYAEGKYAIPLGLYILSQTQHRRWRMNYSFEEWTAHLKAKAQNFVHEYF